jgi:predicted XRE-type DNA-binding protein
MDLQLTEKDEEAEAYVVRRLHGVNNDIRAVADYRRNLAAARRNLARELIETYGWSQRDVAAELDISQAAVSKLLKGQPASSVTMKLISGTR